MTTQHSLGSTARIYFDLIASGVGATAQTPTLALQRKSDGMWFKASDNTWQVGIENNPMTELDAIDMAGRYYFDFDQTKDILSGSKSYVAKKVNSGAPVALEYEDVSFGPLAATASPLLCSVQGTLLDSAGEPMPGSVVTAHLQPVLTDGPGRAFGATMSTTYTDAQGDFDLALVRGGIYRLRILVAGYDRKVLIPQQSSVLFTDL